MARSAGISPCTNLSPREESNLHVQLRRLALYPLSYEELIWCRADLRLIPLSGTALSTELRAHIFLLPQFFKSLCALRDSNPRPSGLPPADAPSSGLEPKILGPKPSVISISPRGHMRAGKPDALIH